MRKKILLYNPKLKNLPSKLRKNSTRAESLLWNQIRNKQIKGYKFRRQVPIQDFIVDFFSKELRLAIEIDGSSHNKKFIKDKLRQEKLEELNISFLRFTESEVQNNLEGVVINILDLVEKMRGSG